MSLRHSMALRDLQMFDYSGGSRISRRGGVDLVVGVWTPEAVMFRKFCMSKRKNLDPQGGHAPGTPPLDPPMGYVNPDHFPFP